VRDGERGAARQRAPVEERLDPGTGFRASRGDRVPRISLR